MDNPAGRLRYWIARFDAYPHRDRPVSVAAAEFLGHDSSPASFAAQVAFMRLGISLADTCQEVRRETALLPEYLHPEMLLSDFSQVEAYVLGITLARQTPVQHLNAPLDAAGLRGLEFLDRYLSANRPQTWIEDEARSLLTNQVRDLIDRIMADDELSGDTKQFVTARLADVETALRDARLDGTPAIERATDGLIGSVRREPIMWQRIVEGGLGGLLSNLVMALVLALGQQPTDNVLPPAQPTVEIGPDATEDEPGHYVVRPESDGIVDAEIVDETGHASAKEVG